MMNRSMMPQQIMSLAGGGGISSFIPRETMINGQPHQLSYIRPDEAALLQGLGGMGTPGPGGIPQYSNSLFEKITGKPFKDTALGKALGVGGAGSTTPNNNQSNDSGPTLSASAAAQLNDVRQDENGNWYAVKQIEGTNALGRDYSIDPKDNSQGPTFGGNVSDNIMENFPDEVGAAGGSTAPGSISDTFKNTDKEALGFDPGSNTFVPVDSLKSSLDKEKDGITVQRKDGSYVTKYADGTYSSSYSTALDAYYAQEDRENTLKQNIANLLTPLDDKKYVDGVLVNTTTGNAVSPFVDKTGQEFADNLIGAGVLGLSGKQVPDAPFTQGNTPMLGYTGGNEDTRSYEVLGGLDENAPPSMSKDKDGSLFVPYDGADPYSFDASTNFPGSTDPNSPDYNMSKDLAETGSYYGFKFDESGKIPLQDADGNYIIDQSQKIESAPFENEDVHPVDFPIFDDNLIATLNEEGKAHLLKTGDDSKMIVKDPITGGYEYIDGSPVLNPNTGEEIPAFDATGGDGGLGDIFNQDGDTGSDVIGDIGGGGSGDGGGDGGGEDTGEDTDEDEQKDSGASSLNFYAGYNPVGISDVLVQNPYAGIPYVPTTDPRIMPLRYSGITSLYNFPATRSMYQGIMS